METWKTIPSAPNYAASDLGRIKRIARGKRTQPGRLLTPHQSPNGYLGVSVYVDTNQYYRRVNRLVMEAFHGPSELQVNHKNGIKADNRLENLEYVTGAENRRHAKRVLDAYAAGERHPNAKLTERDVRSMFEMKNAGFAPLEIAKRHGCTRENVYLILKRKAWAHVSVEPTPPNS